MSTAKAPDTLVELAPELLELVLAYLDPQELTRFGQTCRRARDFIRPSNQILWKAVFLQKFDHPKHVWQHLVPTARADSEPREALWDWHRELVRRIKVSNLLLENDRLALAPEIENVVNTLLDIQQTASRTDYSDPNQPASLNIKHLEHLERQVGGLDHIVHDFSRHPASLAVPRDSKLDQDGPVTRSMLRRSAVAPEWASRFHVRRRIRDPLSDRLTT